MRNTLKLALLLLVVAALAPLATAQMTTNVGGFTMRFVGVEYDWDAGTSKWTYGLTWNDGYQSPNSPSHNNPALSHLTMDLCDSGVEVLDVEPDFFVIRNDEGASDPGDWGFVIKWDELPDDALTLGVEYFFSFTLGDTYAVDSNTFFAKAGQDHNQGLIFGPSTSCAIATPSIDVTKSCVPEAWVGDTIAYTITVTNTGNVALADVSVDDPLAGLHQTIATLGAGASQQFTASIATSQAGTIDNVVNAAGSYWGNSVTDSASCSTNVQAPQVSKSANTSYERSWDWTIAKSVTEETLNFCGTGTADLHYSIAVTRDNTDSHHAVTGAISIFNPTATLTLNIATVTDAFGGYGATISCPSNAVGPGASISCSYEITLPNAIDGTNEAHVTLSNGSTFNAFAPVAFGNPSVETDETATVVDAVTCPDGFTCSAAGPYSFADDGSVNVTITLTKTTAECNSYFTVVNGATLRAESGESRGSSASTQLYTCECGHGCTLTIGYWKTHAGFTGRNADDVTQFLPIWLGTAYGARSVQVTNATQAVSILKFELGAASNGITKLYAQLLGAKLSIAHGASDADVASIIAKADAFLALNDQGNWGSLSKKQRSDVLTWMTLLDAYNNGDLGPGHCN